MLVPSLIMLVVVLGAVLVYVYVIAPRLNPLNRADNFLSQNLVEEAIVEYKKILDDSPNDFVVHWKLANIHYDRNEPDECVLHLEEIMRIGTFNSVVEKGKVQKKLAELYLARDDLLKVFQNYYELLKSYPADPDALYHVAFILLGQEYFDAALRHFERLLKQERKDFEILFGAGIASYQLQKAGDATDYFREALAINPRSDIANLAMALALRQRHDVRAAMGHARAIIDESKDQDAVFVAKRLCAILAAEGKRPAEGVAMLEDILERARGGGMEDEMATILYDIGFVSLGAGMTEQAYEHWNQLYQIDRGYKNVQHLITLVRREMDAPLKGAPRDRETDSVLSEYSEEWLRGAFPDDFLWSVCGLRSPARLDLGGVMAAVREARDDASGPRKTAAGASAQSIDALLELDAENFRIIANRAVGRLGYRVDDILPTYREGDGVDFIAFNQTTKEKTLVWFRRWKDLRVSDVTLRNLAQAVNDAKAKQGLFVTTSELTEAAEEAAQRLSRVRIVRPDELSSVLAALI